MSNRFLEEYLTYFNFWLMQRENVQYVANSKNYWYRSESEKSGLWVKNTCGGKLLSFEPNSCSHNKFIVNFGVWCNWASRIYWRYLKISNISMTPPKCASCSNFFRMLNFDYFDKILKTHTDMRWLMSQKVLFWWWTHIHRFTSSRIFKIWHFELENVENCWFSKQPILLLKLPKMLFEGFFVLGRHQSLGL